MTLAHLTVTGGRTTGEIRRWRRHPCPDGYTTLTLDHSDGQRQQHSGHDAGAAGSPASDVTLTDSTVSGNSTAGDSADGGGIYGDAVTLTDSTVSGNSTAGDGADGGGIAGLRTCHADRQHGQRQQHGRATYARGGGIYGCTDVRISHHADQQHGQRQQHGGRRRRRRRDLRRLP